MRGFQKWNEIETLLDNFEAITLGLDARIANELRYILAQLDSSSGRLTPQNLTRVFEQIDQLFRREFAGSDFGAQVEKMKEVVGLVADAAIDVNREVNQINLGKEELNREANLSLHVETITSSLSSAGLAQNTIIPVKRMVSSAVTQGKGVKALIDELTVFFDEGSNAQLTDIRGRSLTSYTKQIANDAVNAANGQVQVYVKERYGLKRFRYIGNTIRDSRPFCKHMIDDEKYPMSIEQLEPILKAYVGNKTKVRNGTLKSGAPKMVPKGAGMYPDTNTRNFPLVVGGYNCRHRFVFVR